MTTITDVEVTRDLSFANIYISVLGDMQEKKSTLEGLESAKGFIRNEIGKKLDLRHVPEPIFHLDESIERGMYLSELIDKTNKENDINGNNYDE